MSATLDTARLLLSQGIATIPVRPDKKPLVDWKRFQTSVPTEAELKKFFSVSNQIALSAGRVCALDFDEKYSRGIYERFKMRAIDVGLDGLLFDLILQQTPSGGYHLVFQTTNEATQIGNLKLANKANNEVMIETRGKGGYFLISPSNGYTLLQGDWTSIPIISDEDRDALLDLARSFDERSPVDIPHHDPSPAEAQPGMTPGDDYDFRADVPALLKAHGWKPAGGSGKYWTRPGKDRGISASWDMVPDRLWVFSSSTQFEPMHCYRPWHIYAVLECGGDFGRAAKELRRQGFGGEIKPARKSKLILEDLKRMHAEQHEDPPGIEGTLQEEDPFGIEFEQPPHRAIRAEDTAVPFTTWRPSQFIEYIPDPNGDLLEGGYLTKGEWTSLLGVGGLGKSRLALWLCICQMCGQKWCDLPTSSVPQRTLFLSTENGVIRWKADLTKMFSVLEPRHQEIVEEHLHILALTPEEEGDLNLGDRNNVAKLIATLRHVQPELIVLDPFADMVDGDENSTADIVSTLRVLRKVHREGAPEAAVLIIHHARTGAANVAQAGDNYSAGNFGRGSKALYSRVRCELQLAPGDRNDPSRLVLACGKSNNAEKFKPRGLIFDPSCFAYSTDPQFNYETWRADVMGKNRGGSGPTVTDKDVVVAVNDLEPKYADGVPTSTLLEAVCENTGSAKRTVNRAIAASVEAGFVIRSERGRYTIGFRSL
jgi:hypothetical protein